MQVTPGKSEESGPAGNGRMAPGVLPETKVAIDQWGLDGRKVGRTKVFCAKQPVDRPGGDFGQEHPGRVGPTIALGVGVAVAHAGTHADE